MNTDSESYPEPPAHLLDLRQNERVCWTDTRWPDTPFEATVMETAARGVKVSTGGWVSWDNPGLERVTPPAPQEPEETAVERVEVPHQATIVDTMNKAEAEECVAQINANATSIRTLLVDLYEREGWRALGYKSWRACSLDRFQSKHSHLYRMLMAGLIERDIAPGNEDVALGQIPERVLRPLSRLSIPDRNSAWKLACEMAGEELPSCEQVEADAVHISPPKPKEPADKPGKSKQLLDDTVLSPMGDNTRQNNNSAQVVPESAPEPPAPPAAREFAGVKMQTAADLLKQREPDETQYDTDVARHLAQSQAAKPQGYPKSALEQAPEAPATSAPAIAPVLDERRTARVEAICKLAVVLGHDDVGTLREDLTREQIANAEDGLGTPWTLFGKLARAEIARLQARVEELEEAATQEREPVATRPSYGGGSHARQSGGKPIPGRKQW